MTKSFHIYVGDFTFVGIFTFDGPWEIRGRSQPLNKGAAIRYLVGGGLKFSWPFLFFHKADGKLCTLACHVKPHACGSS